MEAAVFFALLVALAVVCVRRAGASRGLSSGWHGALAKEQELAAFGVTWDALTDRRQEPPRAS